MKTKLEVNQHIETGNWTVRVMLEVGKDHTVVLTAGADPDIKVAASWCLRNFTESAAGIEKLLRNFGADDSAAMLDRLRTMSPSQFGAPSLRARAADCPGNECRIRGMCTSPTACTAPSWLAYEHDQKGKAKPAKKGGN